MRVCLGAQHIKITATSYAGLTLVLSVILLPLQLGAPLVKETIFTTNESPAQQAGWHEAGAPCVKYWLNVRTSEWVQAGCLVIRVQRHRHVIALVLGTFQVLNSSGWSAEPQVWPQISEPAGPSLHIDCLSDCSPS